MKVWRDYFSGWFILNKLKLILMSTRISRKFSPRRVSCFYRLLPPSRAWLSPSRASRPRLILPSNPASRGCTTSHSRSTIRTSSKWPRRPPSVSTWGPPTPAWGSSSTARSRSSPTTRETGTNRVLFNSRTLTYIGVRWATIYAFMSLIP